MENPLRLTWLNHISIVCRSLEKSLDFYQNVLGFIPIRRPGSFDFDGAWLFNYGFGIHLLQSEDPENMRPVTHIDPKDNHISFQCESMGYVEKRLSEMSIPYVKNRVEEGGIGVDQIFFHDPDGMMIEVCNCDVLPVIPISPRTTQKQQQQEYTVQQPSPRSCQQLQCTTAAAAGSAASRLPSMEKRITPPVLNLAKSS